MRRGLALPWMKIVRLWENPVIQLVFQRARDNRGNLPGFRRGSESLKHHEGLQDFNIALDVERWTLDVGSGKATFSSIRISPGGIIVIVISAVFIVTLRSMQCES
jgi:hypothetical protein